MNPYQSRLCPRCTSSLLLWDNEDNCIWCAGCGYRPRITPLGEWLAKVERPTGRVYKQRVGSKVPPTRVYE